MACILPSRYALEERSDEDKEERKGGEERRRRRERRCAGFNSTVACDWNS